jgi:hypothetical protein
MTGIGLAAGFSALLIAGGHWFPWRALLHRDLHRVEAYIYGVLAILGPACVALWVRGDWYAIYLVGACAVAAGAVTVTTKAIDRVAEWRNELHDMRARQDAERRAMSAHD